jgi:vancomycin permeability regulator SanA
MTAHRTQTSSHIIARGLAFFIAGFCALNLLSYLFGNYANQNTWWIDFWPLPSICSAILQFLCPLVLFAFVFAPRLSPWRRAVTSAVCAIFMLLSLYNGIMFYVLLAQGQFTSQFPLPFSFLVCALFLCILVASLRSRPGDAKDGGAEGVRSDGGRADGARSPWSPWSPQSLWPQQPQLTQPLPPLQQPQQLQQPPRAQPLRALATVVGITATVLAAALVFPLAQTLCFGMTDYRQPVDATVVLGAQVMPNGSLSHALENRVMTAIDLYDEGLTPVLIMSGGTDVEGNNEALAMRDYAIAHGVPASAVLVDTGGMTTEATAHNTAQICRREGFTKVCAVSTFYHLPRIKQLFLVQGIDVYTVPAQSYRSDGSEPLTTLREIPGWWLYWFKGLIIHPT